MEILLNFALELLVPKSILLEYINGKKVTLELIKEIEEKYQVLLVAMEKEF